MSTIGIHPSPGDASSRGKRSIFYAIGGVALGIAAVIYYLKDPNTTGGFPQCLFHRLTHLFCPGCGSQRAAHALLHGNILTALHDNALLCVSIPLLAWEMIATRSRRLPSLLQKRFTGWIVFFVVVVFWIARNVPIWPCTLLAPMG